LTQVEVDPENWTAREVVQTYAQRNLIEGELGENEVPVRLQKRAHNPLLKEAGLAGPTRPVPWLGGHTVVVDLS
jgi:hypothetical protein